ncbi:MAG: 6-phosphogluconolactonase, partial [Gemmatimonadetes bacterium]|nr:6-phosphogluconolactonase [Gemmatimonadota bacterium]
MKRRERKMKTHDDAEGDALFESRERIPTTILGHGEIARTIAERIAGLIREKNDRGESTVLGLATGSTPIGVYRELIRMHREEALDFSRVVTFSLDEYLPMDPDSHHSYARFMRENLFDHINIDKANTRVPDGTAADPAASCQQYEEDIKAVGGIDFQVLGIGGNGHIAFNEPG